MRSTIQLRRLTAAQPPAVLLFGALCIEQPDTGKQHQAQSESNQLGTRQIESKANVDRALTFTVLLRPLEHAQMAQPRRIHHRISCHTRQAASHRSERVVRWAPWSQAMVQDCPCGVRLPQVLFEPCGGFSSGRRHERAATNQHRGQQAMDRGRRRSEERLAFAHVGRTAGCQCIRRVGTFARPGPRERSRGCRRTSTTSRASASGQADTSAQRSNSMAKRRM